MEQRVNNFLDRIHQAASVPDVQEVLEEITQSYGFERYLVTSVPKPVNADEQALLLTTWKNEWVFRYIAQDYISHDPVIPRLLQSDLPFEWSELGKDKPLSKKARMVMEEAHTLGEMKSGFCIPIYGPAGAQDSISFATSQDHSLSEKDKRALHILGIYAVARVREILGKPREVSAPKLTKREVDCLKWSSLGKTSWETSEILGISQATVDHYLHLAIQKLQATNRVQAVAEAMRLKLIN
ncbi:MAG: LuxR family transcriptional regulator [Cohaesibacter sp.]|jgi:LuxR family quorum sensing-dependent transcriptional regulator|nr:LuxR family transcriptional regulator [Cohaesibacter sp.]